MKITVIGSLVIFALTYYGIINRRIHRTIAAMSGGIFMILIGHWMGFYDANQAIDYIDFNTIGLLFGMMIIVGMLGDTGFFRYLAIKIAKFSNGSYYKLLALLVLVTAFTSAFLDNVTTILLMVPITITIARELDVTPIPFLMAELIASNIGGTMTLIGDPPNIMIGSAANIHFIHFIIYLAPIVIIVLFIVLLVFELSNYELLNQEMTRFDDILKLDANASIVNYDLLKKTIFILTITILLFTVHHILNLEPWFVAVLGASLLLLLTFTEPEEALKHVHWETLLFFMGLFIVIGGLHSAGVIEIIALEIEIFSGHSLVLSMFIIIMISGLFAIVMGNIPAAIILIPVVNIFIDHSGLGAGFIINPLWWALSLGTCFGGNGTLISAPANLVVSNISNKMGEPISFWGYARKALPITILSLFLSFIFLWLFYIVLL
ncbi:MAG: SLC13 family permease [Thermoplasmatota archaeon]